MCSPGFNAYGQPDDKEVKIEAFKLPAGSFAPVDSFCFESEGVFPALQGKLELCAERKLLIAECQVRLDELPEHAPLEWYESPWFWGMMGIAIGLGTTISLSAF